MSEEIVNKKYLRTWVEIDKKAISKNYKIFRSILSKDCMLMSVVKSNAYGHGLVPFSKEVVSLGVDWLGVDSVVEAITLRKEGIKIPILVFGHTLFSHFENASRHDISFTISNLKSLREILKTKSNKKFKIHIKVDTGMNRQGFSLSDIKKVVELLKKGNKKILVEGLYTHFSSAENPSFSECTKKQINIFKEWVKAFELADLKPIVHASATSGAILFENFYFDMVRVGIGMYGLWPSKEVKEYAKRRLKLKPVLSWKSVVREIKTLPKGSGVGYDLTEILKRKSLVVIVPVGYWHGYPRNLSSIGSVFVKGKEAKLLGRVSMDMIVIDVTNISKVKVGDEVVILGAKGLEVDKIAHLADTINYEIVTRINPLIKRIYR